MSARAFVASAYALLVETWMGLDNDMLTAIDKVNEQIGLSMVEETEPGVPNAAGNAAALAELERMIPR